MKRPQLILFALLMPCLLLLGCETDTEDAMEDAMEDTAGMENDMEMVPKAMAALQAVSESNVSGTVTFTQEADGMVRVEGTVMGLTPGMHGFHIHENGDCGDNAQAAGGHFAPMGHPHGAPSDSARHVGDLGNIQAGDDGMATFSMTDSMIALAGTNSIVGKALIVHSGEDDLTTQPTGNAGDRVACAVVQMAGDDMMMDDDAMMEEDGEMEDSEMEDGDGM